MLMFYRRNSFAVDTGGWMRCRIVEVSNNLVRVVSHKFVLMNLRSMQMQSTSKHERRDIRDEKVRFESA